MTAEEIAGRTHDAYSRPRFEDWTACAQAILDLGHDARTTEYILRSKLVRWAADRSGCDYGKVPAIAIVEFLKADVDELTTLLAEIPVPDELIQDPGALVYHNGQFSRE